MNKTIFRSLILAVLFAGSPLALQALDVPDAGTSYSYPLPALVGGTVNLAYTMAGPGSVQVLAYNEAGDQVVHFNDLKPAGLQTSQVDLCCLAPGVYLYLILITYDSGATERLKPGKFVVVH